MPAVWLPRKEGLTILLPFFTFVCLIYSFIHGELKVPNWVSMNFAFFTLFKVSWLSDMLRVLCFKCFEF